MRASKPFMVPRAGTGTCTYPCATRWPCRINMPRQQHRHQEDAYPQATPHPIPTHPRCCGATGLAAPLRPALPSTVLRPCALHCPLPCCAPAPCTALYRAAPLRPALPSTVLRPCALHCPLPCCAPAPCTALYRAPPYLADPVHGPPLPPDHPQEVFGCVNCRILLLPVRTHHLCPAVCVSSPPPPPPRRCLATSTTATGSRRRTASRTLTARSASCRAPRTSAFTTGRRR